MGDSKCVGVIMGGMGWGKWKRNRMYVLERMILVWVGGWICVLEDMLIRCEVESRCGWEVGRKFDVVFGGRCCK